MPKATPLWKIKMPEFLGAIAGATEENDIRMACEEIKEIVVGLYPDTPNSRRKPMGELRKAIRGRFPVQEGKSEHESVPFPYFFAENGTGKVKRWEHLAIKYLEEEWNKKQDRSDVEVAAPEVAVSEVAAPEVAVSEVAAPEVAVSEVAAPEIAVSEVAAPEVAVSEVDILNEVGLSDEELAIVKEAIGDADIKEWIKQAMIQRAKAVNNLNERLAEDLSMVPSEELMHDKRYRTNTNACRELTSRAVRAIKKFNAQSPEYRWCITNALISEITGNTVKAIAKAVEGMDIESYNRLMDLQPVNNRLTKAAIGDIKNVVSIKDVFGIDE